MIDYIHDLVEGVLEMLLIIVVLMCVICIVLHHHFSQAEVHRVLLILLLLWHHLFIKETISRLLKAEISILPLFLITHSNNLTAPYHQYTRLLCLEHRQTPGS